MSSSAASSSGEPKPFMTGNPLNLSSLNPPPSSLPSPADASFAYGINPAYLPPLPSPSYDLPVSSYPGLTPSASSEQSGSSRPIIQFDPRASPPYDDEEEDDDDAEAGVAGRPKKRKSVANLRGAAAKEGQAKPSGGGDGDDGEEKGRRKIMIEYIEEKSKRHITFSKRKAGIMKKAYELSTLTGTQVLLLVVSESGWVYTFTTDKFKPLVKEDEHGQLSQGQKLIAACLEAKEPAATPYPPVSTAASFEANSAIHGGQIALKTNSRPQPAGRPLSTNRRVSSKGRHHIPLAINTGHPSMPLPPPHGHPHSHPHHQLPTPMSGNYLDPSLGGMGIGGPNSPRGRSRSGGGPPISPGQPRQGGMQMMQQQAQAQQQMGGGDYDQILQRTDQMHMHHGGAGGGQAYDGGQPQYDAGLGMGYPSANQAQHLSGHAQQHHPEPVYHHMPPQQQHQPPPQRYDAHADYGGQDPYRQMAQQGQGGGVNYGQEGDR